MPKRPKSTLVPPEITPNEAEARTVIRQAMDLTRAVKVVLEVAYHLLPDPPDAEAMGEGTIPESLTYALRGSIEVVQADHVAPAIATLTSALEETPKRLIQEWLRKYPKGGNN